MLQVFYFNTKQWFLTQNEVLKWHENLQSRLLLVIKSTKCTILRIYFFNKVLWDFPGLNNKNSQAFPGVFGDFQASKNFPGFPGPVQTLNGTLGFVVLRFWPFLPQFFRVRDFEAQFCSFLQHCNLQLLVFIVGGLQFPDVHGFSIAL